MSKAIKRNFAWSLKNGNSGINQDTLLRCKEPAIACIRCTLLCKAHAAMRHPFLCAAIHCEFNLGASTPNILPLQNSTLYAIVPSDQLSDSRSQRLYDSEVGNRFAREGPREREHGCHPLVKNQDSSTLRKLSGIVHGPRCIYNLEFSDMLHSAWIKCFKKLARILRALQKPA